MSESIKDIVVRITAQKGSFEAFDSAASSMNQLSAEMQEAQAHATNFGEGIKEANEASASLGARLSASAEGFAKIGEFGHMAMSMMDRYEISQLNLENANMAVANAQIRYNEAVQKYGEHSREAAVAADQLQRSQNNLEKTNIHANMSMAMIGITAVGMIPQIVAFGTKMTTMLKEVETATLLTTIRIKAMAPELLILGAIAGGAYYMMSTQAAAAREASDAMTASMTAGFTAASDEANKLKNIIEEIQNKQQSSGMKAEQRKIEYETSVKVVQEDQGLSQEEKAKQIGDLNLKYAEDIMRLELEDSKLGWEKATTDDKRGQAKEEYAKRELELQKLLNEEQKKGAGGQLIGPHIKAETSLTSKTLSEVTFEPSKSLGDILTAAVNDKKAIDVNIVSSVPLPTIKEPGLVETYAPMIAGTAATALMLTDTSKLLEGRPTITGNLAGRLGTLISSSGTASPTIGIPSPQIFIPPEIMERVFEKLNITINLDRQGTRDFFRDGVMDTLNYD
ncbi:Uncharacterised protein [uncultured archaeon]|nr:Uncharacterised protein [uncultured archaeon]